MARVAKRVRTGGAHDEQVHSDCEASRQRQRVAEEFVTADRRCSAGTVQRDQSDAGEAEHQREHERGRRRPPFAHDVVGLRPKRRGGDQQRRDRDRGVFERGDPGCEVYGKREPGKAEGDFPTGRKAPEAARKQQQHECGEHQASGGDGERSGARKRVAREDRGRADRNLAAE
jgi:hypothetical protein